MAFPWVFSEVASVLGLSTAGLGRLACGGLAVPGVGVGRGGGRLGSDASLPPCAVLCRGLRHLLHSHVRLLGWHIQYGWQACAEFGYP